MGKNNKLEKIINLEQINSVNYIISGANINPIYIRPSDLGLIDGHYFIEKMTYLCNPRSSESIRVFGVGHKKTLKEDVYKAAKKIAKKKAEEIGAKFNDLTKELH